MRHSLLITALLVATLAVGAFGADVKVSYSGPSGQGDTRFVSTTGVTNLTMTATGIENLTIADEQSLPQGQDQLKDGSLRAALTTTNAQPVTLSGMVNRLSAVGNTINLTNTITLSALASGEAGNLFLIVNTGTSNALAIAKSGTWKSDAVALDENASMWVLAISSNSFYAAGK